MRILCDHCSAPVAVPEDKVRGKRVRFPCSRCGASIVFEGPKDDAEPDSFRDPLETLPVDPRSLARLVRLGSDAEVDSLLEASRDADVDSLLDASRGDAEVSELLRVSPSPPTAIGGANRAPEVSALFELRRPEAIPLTGIRAPQASIPFVLVSNESNPPRAPQPTVAFELRRSDEAFGSDLRAMRRGRGLLIALVLLVALGSAFVARERLLELLLNAGVKIFQ